MEKLKGFENYYIDKEGNIYTKDKKLMTGKFVDNTGYYQIVLRKNGKRSYQRLHRLIAIQFIDNPNNLPQVNHKDGNKLNNSLDNLEWCTQSHNIKEAVRLELMDYSNNTFVPKKVIQINKDTKEIIKIYNSIIEASKELKINRTGISNCCSGRYKTSGGYIWKYA